MKIKTRHMITRKKRLKDFHIRAFELTNSIIESDSSKLLKIIGCIVGIPMIIIFIFPYFILSLIFNDFPADVTQ